MRIFTLLFLSYASMLWGQQPEIAFEIKPNSIAPGDSAELIWQVKNADLVYISNIGKAQPAGRIKISPDNSTAYTLIAESAAGIISKTDSLEVTGTRGEGDFPDASEFKFKNVYKLSAIPSPVKTIFWLHLYWEKKQLPQQSKAFSQN